jgi:hypothetical protein
LVYSFLKEMSLQVATMAACGLALVIVVLFADPILNRVGQDWYLEAFLALWFLASFCLMLIGRGAVRLVRRLSR